MDSRTSFDTIQVYFVESLPRQLGDMAEDIRVLQSHSTDKPRQAALAHLKDSAFAITSAAEPLGLRLIAQRARSLLLFLNTLPPRKGVFESDEVLALTRAFNRLLIVARVETADGEDRTSSTHPTPPAAPED